MQDIYFDKHTKHTHIRINLITIFYICLLNAAFSVRHINVNLNHEFILIDIICAHFPNNMCSVLKLYVFRM